MAVLNTAQEYYTIQHSADPVNREKGNITYIGLLEVDEDKILVAQVEPYVLTARSTSLGTYSLPRDVKHSELSIFPDFVLVRLQQANIS